LVWWL